MIKNDKVSIIIPVYNVEKYIDRCIKSILEQTFKELEIILVNDGSSDNSLKILRKYEKENKNIHVFDQKNSGPAIARNNGMKQVKTKYLMFIDSDDYIDSDYVETYYNAIKDTDYDVVMGGFRKTDGNKVSFTRSLDNGEFSKYVVTGPVSKIYRTSFLQKHDISYLDTNSSEDIYFSLKVIHCNAKIKTIDYVGYNYYDNLKSLSNTQHKGFKQEIKILELLDEINYRDGLNVELNQYFIIRYCVWYLLYSGKNATADQFMFEYNKLFHWLSDNISNYKKNRYIKINGPKGEIPKIGNIIFAFMLLHKVKLVKLFSKIYCNGKGE